MVLDQNNLNYETSQFPNAGKMMSSSKLNQSVFADQMLLPILMVQKKAPPASPDTNLPV